MEKIELEKARRELKYLKEEVEKVKEEKEAFHLGEELKDFKKESRKEARKERNEKREKEKELKEIRIKTRNRQIFITTLLIGISGTCSLIMWQKGNLWIALSIGIMAVGIFLRLKTTLLEAVPTVGDRLHARLFFALGCWSLIGYLMTWGFFSIPFFENTSILMKIGTFGGLGLVIIGITWKNFTFDVPQWIGINVYNYFTGKQTTFLPGFYFKFPWELIKPESTHSLKSMKEEITQRSYPTGGGTVLIAKFMFQFAPDPFNLITFEGVENKVIKQGLMEHVSSTLLSYIAEQGRTARGIRANIQDLHEAIRDEFGIDENEKRTLENPKKASPLARNQSPIEKSYGIILIITKLSDLDFEDAYQKILTSSKAREQIQTMANAIYDDACEEMTRKEAWDQAMILSEKATGRVIKITGDRKAIPMVNTGGDK